MRALLFLSRVALVCNIAFLGCLYFRHISNLPTGQEFNKTMIVIGWVISPTMNVIVNVWRSNLIVQRKTSPVPRWLGIINLLFLLFQIVYFFL